MDARDEIAPSWLGPAPVVSAARIQPGTPPGTSTFIQFLHINQNNLAMFNFLINFCSHSMLLLYSINISEPSLHFILKIPVSNPLLLIRSR